MLLTQHPLVRFSYIAPIGMVAAVSGWLELPWWGLALLAGCALLLWDWLWGFDWLKDSSTPWTLATAGALEIAVSYLLAQRLGLSIDDFVALRASAPRRADWLYWLPGSSLGVAVYGLVLRLIQIRSDHW